MVGGEKPGVDSRDEVKHTADGVDGGASVTKDEARVLRRG